ncbi:MAG: hypothetical protein WCI89_00145 [bacterium]
MTDELSKLFGSPSRAKLLRLFLFNPKQSFSPAEAVARARVLDREARRELNLFFSIGVVERKIRGKGFRYQLNTSFEYVAALQNLLLNAPARGADILAHVRPAGTLKVVVLSGVFMGEWEGSLDLLIVGDKIKERILRDALRKFEAEIGKEIRYAFLSTEDFLYRLNMNDKLVRDVLDYPHKVVLDRLNFGLV